MNVEELVKELKAVAISNDAVAMKAYMKNKFEFLGVKTPARRKLVKAFFKQQTDCVIDWNFINEAWNNPYRELQYVALDYLEIRKKLLTPSDLPDLKKLAQTKSWWDTVDLLSKIIGDVVNRNKELKTLMLEWSKKENDIWLRRVAILHQLSFKENVDKFLLEAILEDNLCDSEFFINKAIGWALRDYSKVNPEWVRKFIEKNRSEMANLSLREASKYLN